ncbi:hypothetical protein WJX72_009310 [[Myrmecia] bisecta]|uniref:Uncharacterized protein n=1 Tax=[Myrmecia] bisecta TaxID=41462 RepID=A0AAW1QG62_9CHLO
MVPVQEEADPGLHPKSKATRRGPMDEMRQLVRILVKIIPHSVGFIATSDEGGGGNRISEEQIKHYLDYTLGEAPRPAWGVPGGWGEYMSGLFTWATGKEITKDQAMRCAKREPGRSWEAIESELNKLGIFPATWPLPLSKEGLGQAAECPVPQPVPNAGSKRAGDDHKPAPSSKRRNVGGAADLDSLPEVELWQRALGCLQAVRRRLGTSPPEQQPQLSQLKSDVRLVVDELIGPYTGAFSGQPSAQTLSFAMPVIVQGPNGQLQQAYQLQTATMPPQMSGFPMGSMPPQTGSGVMQSAAPPTSMMSGGQPPTSYQAASGPSSSQYLLSQPGSQSAFQAVHPASQQPSQQGGLERTSSGHEVTKPQVFRPNASRPTPGGQVTSGSIPPRVGSAGPDGMRTNSPGAEMQHMVQQAIDRQQQMNPLPHLGPGGLEGPRPDVPASPSTEDDGERGPGSLQGTGTSKRQAPPAGGANKGLPFGMVYRPQAIKPDPKGQQRTSPGGDFNMDDEHPAPAPEAQGMPSAASAPFQSLLMDPAMMANPTYAPPGFMPPSVTSGAPMQHQQGMGHPAYAVPGQPGMVQPNGFGVAGSAAAQADGAAYVLPPQTDLQAPPQQPASSGWMPSVSAMLQ